MQIRSPWPTLNLIKSFNSRYFNRFLKRFYTDGPAPKVFLKTGKRYTHTGPNIGFLIGAKARVHVMEVSADGTFDTSEFEHFWMKEENILGVDYTSPSWKSQTALDTVKEKLKGRPPLLPVKFQKLPITDEIDGAKHSFDNTFRVMQWNILAQGLSIGKDNFVKCPTEALHWDNRRLQLLEEILLINPDVLCMQEVDHFAFFKGALSPLGYEGIFFPKPDSPALYVENSNGPDGCAMFYKTSKINLLEKDTIVLKDMDGVYFTNQVAIIMKFTLPGRENMTKELYIVTTHLKAKDNWADLRHSQGTFLVKYLENKVGKSPLIVCGDFNAESTEPVYKVFRDSALGLESTYSLLSSDGLEPPYTTWKIRGSKDGECEICKTIDYMWYTRSKLSVHSIKAVPPPECIGIGRIPSFQYPSDHFSLAADYMI